MFLDHAYIVRIRRAYMCIGHTYNTYKHINIYQRNSAVELTSVGLAHARPNKTFSKVRVSLIAGLECGVELKCGI